jgi:hypothetical protein
MLTLKDKKGNKIKLFQMRNPQGREMHFNGTWNLKNPKWAELKS